MGDRDARDEQDGPAAQAETQAPVEILAVHEVALVEQADLLQGSAPNQHEGTRDGLDRLRCGRQRLPGQAERGAAEEVLQCAPRRRRQAPAAVLLAAIWIADQAAGHAGAGRMGQGGDHLLDGIRLDQAVWIEQQHIVAGAIAQGGVVGLRETQIAGIGDDA